MRGAASVVAVAFSVLAAVALAVIVVLVVAAAIAVVPPCRYLVARRSCHHCRC